MTSVAGTVQIQARPRARQLRVRCAVDTSLSIPPGYGINRCYLRNLTANAVTGGINIGTADGGAQVVSAVVVGASAIKAVFDALLLLNYFSASAAQTLYITAGSSWNSANVEVIFILDKLVP